jgi:carbon-monoxide dehydrogenase large subunit
MTATEEKSWVGRRVKRHEDRRLLTGMGHFADDMDAVGQLYCAIKRSAHAHARIVHVDTSRAREVPGVLAVISGADAVPHWNHIPPVMDLLGMKLPSVYALATDKVYYQGEAVAAVAAESRYAAEDALSLIEVDYEPLPPVTDIDGALGPVPQGSSTAANAGAKPTLLYEDWEDNIQCDWTLEVGDPDAAFARADHVVRERIVSHRYSAVPLEARAVFSEFDRGRNELTVNAT